MQEEQQGRQKNMQQGNTLGYEKTAVLLQRFAIPSIVAMLVSSLYNIVDQIFIGRGVGKLGNAATTVAFPFSTVCLAIALLVGVGSAARFSLELGKGNKDKAQKAVVNAVWMMVTLGVIYCIIMQLFMKPLLTAFGATKAVMPYALSYARITGFGMPFLIVTNAMCNLIRADGSPKYSMICMVVGAVINTILDPIFIFVFDMGVAGAAIATVISQIVSCAMAVAYLKKFKQITVPKKFEKPDIRECATQASLGMSNSFNQLAITVVQVVMNNSLTYYGARSVYGEDIPLAAAGIVMKTNSILISVFVGLAQGSQPIMGFNYGAKKTERVKAVYKLAVKCAVTIGFLGFLAFQLFPKYVIGLYGETGDALYMKFAIKFMRVFLFMVAVVGVQIISSNFFTAIGKPMKGIFLSLSRQVIFLIPIMLLLPLVLGIDGILFAGPVADGMACVISLLMVRLEMKKW